jgi:hypothetical protein
VATPLHDHGHLLERLVWVLKAENLMLQDSNLAEKNLLRTQILQDLNVGQHHCEHLIQIGSQSIGQ